MLSRMFGISNMHVIWSITAWLRVQSSRESRHPHVVHRIAHPFPISYHNYNNMGPKNSNGGAKPKATRKKAPAKSRESATVAGTDAVRVLKTLRTYWLIVIIVVRGLKSRKAKQL